MELYLIFGLACLLITALTIIGCYWYSKAAHEWEEDKKKYLIYLKWVKSGYYGVGLEE